MHFYKDKLGSKSLPPSMDMFLIEWNENMQPLWSTFATKGVIFFRARTNHETSLVVQKPIRIMKGISM